MQVSFFRALTLSSLIVTAGNACAYLTQILLARLLPPPEFGAANAILALSLATAAPLAITPMLIARMLLTHAGQPLVQAGLMRQVLAASLGIALLIWLAHLPLGDMIGQRLQVSPAIAYALLPGAVASAFLSYVPVGYWQGVRRYSLMALASAANPILRLLGVVGFVAILNAGLPGAIWALIAPGLVVFAWGAMAALQVDAPAIAPPKSTWTSALRFAGPSSLAMLGLMGLAYVDQPIVRALASPEASGHYAAAATLAKIALLLPAAVTAVIFPEAARLAAGPAAAPGDPELPEAARRATVRLINGALLATLAMSGAASAAMIAAPKPMLRLFLGAAYGDAALLLQLLAPAMTLLAVCNLLVTYALARNRFELTWATLSALAGAVSVLLVLQPGPLGAAIVMLIALAVLCAICLAWLARHTTTLRNPAARGA
jgi:O-antigen/teichoic acid export membrane protein